MVGNFFRELWLDITWTYPMGMSRKQAAAWFQAIVDEGEREFMLHQQRFIRELKRELERIEKETA